MRLNIPSCLNLSEYEKNKAQEFVDRMEKKYSWKRVYSDPDECCSMMSNFTFEITYTSIGDNIIIKFGNLPEDREFLPDPELF